MGESVIDHHPDHGPDMTDAIKRRWFLALAAALLSFPALAALSSGAWTTEQGAGGSIVLVSGAWLLWHEGSKMKGPYKIPSLWTVIPPMVVFGVLTVVASVTGIVWGQIMGTYICLVCMLACVVGWGGVRGIWAPVAYLAFLIPLPDIVMLTLTHSLKLLIANSSVSFLAAAGYPVAREGASLFIGPYELVVAAACAGMNSMVSLTALGLFYVYCLHRADWRYALFLCCLLIPLAMFANWARVVIIMLITYYFGDAVGQGMLHEMTGALLFVLAIGAMIGIDMMLRQVAHPVRQMFA